jgi:hypothetical protein
MDWGAAEAGRHRGPARPRHLLRRWAQRGGEVRPPAGGRRRHRQLGRPGGDALRRGRHGRNDARPGRRARDDDGRTASPIPAASTAPGALWFTCAGTTYTDRTARSEADHRSAASHRSMGPTPSQACRTSPRRRRVPAFLAVVPECPTAALVGLRSAGSKTPSTETNSVTTILFHMSSLRCHRRRRTQR